MAKLASRIDRGVGTPDGLDAKGLARGYLALEKALLTIRRSGHAKDGSRLAEIIDEVLHA